jgi:hypothetical protein
MQKDLAMATAHPRNLFAIVHASPGSILMDLVILPQSGDVKGVRFASPMEVLHSLQQKAQTSLRNGKLTRHIAGIEQIQPYALDEESERELSALAQERSEPEPSEALLQAASAFQAAGPRKAANRGGVGWAKVRSAVVPAPANSKIQLSSWKVSPHLPDLGDVAKNDAASRISDSGQNQHSASDRIWRPRKGESKWSKVRDSLPSMIQFSRLEGDGKTKEFVVASQDQHFVP